MGRSAPKKDAWRALTGGAPGSQLGERGGHPRCLRETEQEGRLTCATACRAPCGHARPFPARVGAAGVLRRVIQGLCPAAAQTSSIIAVLNIAQRRRPEKCISTHVLDMTPSVSTKVAQLSEMTVSLSPWSFVSGSSCPHSVDARQRASPGVLALGTCPPLAAVG